MAASDPALPGAGQGRRVAESHSIGRRSRALKAQHLVGRIWRVLLGVVAVIVGAMITGILIGGIGFGGLFFTALVCVLVAALLLRYPRLKVPTREQLAQGSLKEIVGNTELWLETRRNALPAPAMRLVDHIGIQLDALALQLDHVDEKHPAAVEIRKLVGDYLPGIVSSYVAIPPALRSQATEGATRPDEALVDSLQRISGEIERVARQLASGMIDDLAIKARMLDYRYGDALSGQDPA